MSDNPKAFKHWFSRATVCELGDRLSRQDRRFDRAALLAHTAAIESLELKARVALIADGLERAIPYPFPKAVALLCKLLPEPFDPSVPNGQFTLGWPLAHFVGRYGLAHRGPALEALHAITQRYTGEFDVRPFLLAEPEATLATLRKWTRDPSEHVRRLVSEGTRTRLPWGVRLQPFIDDPTPVLELLDALHRDASPYVRLSVANNLNDLAKDHPELVVDRLRRWARRPGPGHDALAARALRTLVKQGHAGALALLGVDANVDSVNVLAFQAPASATIGGALPLTASIANDGSEDAKLVVDYAVHYRSAGDRVRAPKVFKWKTFVLGAGQRVVLERELPLRVVTTRKVFPGLHRIDLLVNGQPRASLEFDLRG